MNTIIKKLNLIQTELKAPKGQYNTFGNYSYRNAEDIVEALKPLLKKHDCAIRIADTIETLGDRFYVKATVYLHDVNTGEYTETTAYAREPAIKKGMDEAQITGATSSYARKYALNGLFAIDDTKDADSQDNREEGVFGDRQKQEIDAIQKMEDLQAYWENNKGKGQDFAKYISIRKKQIEEYENN